MENQTRKNQNIETIEKVVLEKLKQFIKKQKRFSDSELYDISKKALEKENYLNFTKEGWSIDYAAERIKEELKKEMLYCGLSSEQITYISGWSWGAFFGGVIWAIGNKLYLWAFGYLVPFLNIFIWFNLSKNGRKMSWSKSKRKNFEQFKKRQIFLNWIILIIMILYFILSILPTLLIIE